MSKEKVIKKIKDKLRSSIMGKKVIKVVYLGNYGGFHYGKVIEARARYAKRSGYPYPFPRWQHCCYQINDEDGDSYEVSKDGIKFKKGFYLVPDDFPLGSFI